jgi:hypothetical protein
MCVLSLDFPSKIGEFPGYPFGLRYGGENPLNQMELSYA